DLTPRFISEPLSTVQKSGGSVQLRCSAEPSAARLSWLFNGEPLDSRVGEVEIQSGSLTIASLSLSTSGRYQCVANSSVGAVVSAPATVSMASLADFDPLVKPVVAAEEGGTALIGCNVPESNPKAQVRFQVRGKWLEQSTDNYLILPSGNLQILNVSLEDKGSYKCAVYNPVTHDLRVEPSGRKLVVTHSSSAGFGFDILHPVAPQSLAVPRHSALTLECVVSGLPPASIHWLRDGQDALRKGRWRLLHSHLVTDRLEVSDSGNYSCVVGNESGVVKSINYSLTVLGQKQKPKKYVWPLSCGCKSFLISPFLCSRFSCCLRFFASMTVFVSVLSNSENRLLTQNTPFVMGMSLRNYFENTGVLFTPNSFFGCLFSPLGKDSRPVIVSPPASTAVMDGGDVTLSCNATGLPVPVIRWYDSRGLIPSHPS
ncbi:CDON protein, partial [Corythaeola cristata]|nr:CDON protein [Corythaeola cristata]